MRVDIPEEGVFWDNARLILSESEVLWLRHYLGDGGEVGETVGRFCPADVFCVLSFFLIFGGYAEMPAKLGHGLTVMLGAIKRAEPFPDDALEWLRTETALVRKLALDREAEFAAEARKAGLAH